METELKLTVKAFDELTPRELWEIYRLRVAVFVVEQSCPYQEVDDLDPAALHITLRDGDGIAAYIRVLPAGAAYETASVGRVITAPEKRRMGLGDRILREGIRVAQERFGAEELTIGAQVYARKLYENAGFVQISPEYPEDGIPHIKMRWTKGA